MRAGLLHPLLDLGDGRASALLVELTARGPLTPIAPMGAPPAMIVTPPTA
jgi:hypothetical protein